MVTCLETSHENGWLNFNCLKDTYISLTNMVVRCKTVNFNLEVL